MKSSRYIVLFAISITFLGQLLLPGVILCRGEEGHIAVESAFDQCCSTPAALSAGSAPALMQLVLDSSPGDGCGPCSDTFLSPNPCNKPAEQYHVSAASEAVVTAVPYDELTAAGIISNDLSIAPSLALRPIKTTILLI